MDARPRSIRRARPLGFLALLGATAAAVFLIPSGASAAANSCTVVATAGTQTTWDCNIPTGTIAGYEVRQWYTLGDTPPEDGYITHMETDVVDADSGQQVPISRLMLHHIVFLNLAHQDSTCAGQGYTGFDSRKDFGSFAPQRFYAAGEERMKMSLPQGYGYRTKASDTWAILAMVMNHRATPDHALIHYEVTIDTDPSTIPVTPWWLDVRDCRADPIYNVPGVAKQPGASGKHAKGKKAAAAKRKHRKRKAHPRPTTDETADYTIPISGRLVAGAGHVHGGGIALKLTEPSCGNREVAESTPTWGLPDHPFYNVRPVLHEPGPINMSLFRSTTGLPIHAGETLRLNSIYDDSQPHVRVMGIMIVYIAPDPSVTTSCGPIPGWETLRTDQPGRPGPVPFRIPLTGLDANGQAVTIGGPPGRLRNAGRNTVVPVGDRFFGDPNLRIRRGSWVTWQFNGAELHNVTLANGPQGIGSDNLDGGRTFSQRLSRPGVYRFFCALHPTQMHERIVVTASKKKRKR